MRIRPGGGGIKKIAADEPIGKKQPKGKKPDASKPGRPILNPAPFKPKPRPILNPIRPPSGGPTGPIMKIRADDPIPNKPGKPPGPILNPLPNKPGKPTGPIMKIRADDPIKPGKPGKPTGPIMKIRADDPIKPGKPGKPTGPIMKIRADDPVRPILNPIRPKKP